MLSQKKAGQQYTGYDGDGVEVIVRIGGQQAGGECGVEDNDAAAGNAGDFPARWPG